MTTIKLIDKIIAIPANENFLVVGEDNPKDILIKIPKELLTNNIENSQVFLLSQVNNNEVKMEELENFYEGEDSVEYKWTITKEHTFEEGKLTIQIKVLRFASTQEENTEDIIDPEFNRPLGINSSGEWYSYQNFFKIAKVLKPIL